MSEPNVSVTHAGMREALVQAYGALEWALGAIEAMNTLHDNDKRVDLEYIFATVDTVRRNLRAQS
jgi:superfamily II DNA or RNA helicase